MGEEPVNEYEGREKEIEARIERNIQLWPDDGRYLLAQLREARELAASARAALGDGFCKVNKCEGCQADTEYAVDYLDRILKGGD